MADQRMEHEPWPMRAGILLVLGALCGLLVHQLISSDTGNQWSVTDNVARLSLAAFVAIAGLLFAFTLERARWIWSLIFALGVGAVLGLIFYWNGSPESRSADDTWRVFAALLSVAIAAPLFQTMRDAGLRRLPYASVHGHAWTNVVLWCAAWAFVVITWLLALLLANLFQLIGIHLLNDLLDKAWADWMLDGAALGAAIGLLRDRDRIVGLLQRVVTTILSVFAPVLAAGLVLFVLSLPFTGLDALWDQTRATTPILLACVIGAFILANAVIGTSEEEEARNIVLRWSAMALGAVMLPLAVVAAISTGLRVNQHGFTPDRLWAIVFIAIVLACACLYLYALVRGRLNWAERVRPANIRLAIGICIVALLLATPLANFGAISTRDQLARLESGAVGPQDFDWRAMRFDFGPSGVAALQRLKATAANPESRSLAQAALAAQNPWDLETAERAQQQRAAARNLRVIPAGTPIPDALRHEIARAWSCTGGQICSVLYESNANRAVLLVSDCPTGGASRAASCSMPETRTYYLSGNAWAGRAGDAGPVLTPEQRQARLAQMNAALRQGRVEVRDVTRHQVFVDGQPVGDAFE
jgi:hypothetical protein